jgi:hypothetical protein
VWGARARRCGGEPIWGVEEGSGSPRKLLHGDVGQMERKWRWWRGTVLGGGAGVDIREHDVGAAARGEALTVEKEARCGARCR